MFQMKNIHLTFLSGEIDTTKLSVSKTSAPLKTLPELYYQIADLEAFSFHRDKNAINILNQIIIDYPESIFKPKAIFSLSFIYRTLEQDSLATSAENKLLREFPDTEYASYLSKDSKSSSSIQKNLIMKAEKSLGYDTNNAMKLYRSAMVMDSLSEFSIYAAFSIGYFYDSEANVDSALKYYTWINEVHPKSNQAKQASIRLNEINSALSNISNDTTVNNNQERN